MEKMYVNEKSYEVIKLLVTGKGDILSLKRILKRKGSCKSI